MTALTQLALVWVPAFLGGGLIGYGLAHRHQDPPRWWERPWPTGPSNEPSWGAIPEREIARR
ncbi:MAG: hypothetical protein NVSMB29_12320 [Candidatus Dormibacteria bacterium]